MPWSLTSAGWQQGFKMFWVTVAVERDTETDLSRTLENEVLTFLSCANTGCEGTGGAFGRNQNPLASDLTPSAAFSLLLTMPWFSVMCCARAGEGSTQLSRDPQGSFSGPQSLGRDCLMPPTLPSNAAIPS